MNILRPKENKRIQSLKKQNKTHSSPSIQLITDNTTALAIFRKDQTKEVEETIILQCSECIAVNICGICLQTQSTLATKWRYCLMAGNEP